MRQVFFTEFYNNTMVDSDGIVFIDNWHNMQANDCAANGWFAGPWIQWSVVRRNSFSGVSLLARHDANASKGLARCGRFALRAERHANTSDLVAEHQEFCCEDGAQPGGYDIDPRGCDHCSIR